MNYCHHINTAGTLVEYLSGCFLFSSSSSAGFLYIFRLDADVRILCIGRNIVRLFTLELVPYGVWIVIGTPWVILQQLASVMHKTSPPRERHSVSFFLSTKLPHRTM